MKQSLRVIQIKNQTVNILTKELFTQTLFPRVFFLEILNKIILKQILDIIRLKKQIKIKHQPDASSLHSTLRKYNLIISCPFSTWRDEKENYVILTLHK